MSFFSTLSLTLFQVVSLVARYYELHLIFNLNIHDQWFNLSSAFFIAVANPQLSVLWRGFTILIKGKYW